MREPAFTEPEDPELAAAKAKVEMTKVACDYATEFVQNATEAWDDERQELLAKLKTAHMSLSDAHADQKEAAGDMVIGNLENALDDTKATLSMRPKVKALRKVKDKATATQKKACLVYQAAVDELQNIRDERIKIARKAYELAKAKLKLSKSQLKAMLAIGAHVSALAKNAVSSGDDAHVALKLRTTSLAAECWYTCQEVH